MYISYFLNLIGMLIHSKKYSLNQKSCYFFIILFDLMENSNFIAWPFQQYLLDVSELSERHFFQHSLSQELKCQTFCPWSIDVFIFDILLYVLLANQIVSLEQISKVHLGSSFSSLKIKFHFSTKQKFRENDFTKKLNCYVLIMIANIVVNSHICRRQH